MGSPSGQDGAGWRSWYGWALAGIAGAALLAAALWLCVVVLPQRLYPPLSAADLAGLSPAEQAERREGRDTLQNDAPYQLAVGPGSPAGPGRRRGWCWGHLAAGPDRPRAA